MGNKTKILEKDIRKSIVDFLKYQGWFVYHNFGTLGSYVGLSDLTAIKKGQVLFIEVKTEKGHQSEHQKKFEKDVKDHEGHYLVARSVDDVNDYICKNLWKTEVMF